MTMSISVRVPLIAAALSALLIPAAGAITPSPTPVPVASCAIGATCEAESAQLGGGVVVSALHAGYTGSGFADYPGTGSGYVQWTVNVPTAGTYSLAFRYANGGTGDRPLAIAVNGGTAVASLSFPATGAWTNWSVRTQSLNLPAGAVTIRATELPNGPNVDSLKVTATATPTPMAGCLVGAVCEAENAARGGGVVISTQHAGYTGTGFADYPGNGTGYVEWTINVPSTGSYLLAFRYANGGTGDRPMAIALNGATVVSSVSFPVTGSWTNWSARMQTVTLPLGTVKIRATELPNGPNVDSLTVTSITPTPGLPTPTPTATSTPWSTGYMKISVSKVDPKVGEVVTVSVTGNTGLGSFNLVVQGDPVFAESPAPSPSYGGTSWSWNLTAARAGKARFFASVYGETLIGCTSCFGFTTVSASSSEITVTDPVSPTPTPAPQAFVSNSVWLDGTHGILVRADATDGVSGPMWSVKVIDQATGLEQDPTHPIVRVTSQGAAVPPASSSMEWWSFAPVRSGTVVFQTTVSGGFPCGPFCNASETAIETATATSSSVTVP